MIKIVIGKPGTGKTYHTVKWLTEYLRTRARKNKGIRHIFTNISLNLEELQKWADFNKLNIKINDVVTLMTDKDLSFNNEFLQPGEVKKERRGAREFIVVSPGSKAYFWNRIPDKALIIIDEIQKYIGSIKEYGESERQSLVEYFSLHRHKKHDWIFLTQSLMSLSVEVRRVSEQVDEVFNVKSMTLPFPLSIPVSDIFIVLRAFGVRSQVYRVRTGILTSSYKVDYEGPLEVVKMSSEIYKLYQTHTLVKDDDAEGNYGGEEDLPFDLGKGAWLRALKWFIRKHFLHLFLKASFVGAIVFFAFVYLHGWTALVNSYDKAAPTKGTARAVKNPDVLGLGSMVNRVKESDFVNDNEEKTPIIILEGRFFNGDNELKEGSFVSPDKVVKSIDPRLGVIYEDANDYYTRLLSDPFRLSYWLRLARSVDESGENYSDADR